MKNLLIFLLFLVPLFSFSQRILNGTVLDNGLMQPIIGAQLFLPELKIVTQTDSLGRFTIGNLQDGAIVLQISMDGYKTEIKTILIDSKTSDIQILLHTTSHVYPEVLVTADKLLSQEETSNNIVTISSLQMREAGALTLSDGISKLPGVSQLSTGVGISKPVIRGLFGNRIQTVMLGMRFDNQQWQDEHGLGLSDVGVDHVEIIKGAASLLYGSEAMGGVINVVEEKPAAIGKVSTDFSTRFFSNTFGVATDVGVKGSSEKFNWRLRAGVESHADYTDGSNNRVLNSRFGGNYIKASAGFHRKNWVSQNDYMFSLNNFGFLMEASIANLTVDNRQSRSFDMPHHTVILQVLSSQNTIYLKKSKLKWTVGAQYNDRQEQEGGNKVSLDMILSSYSNNLLLIKKLSEKNEISLGTQQLFQQNKNVGSRTIVPDATIFETSLFAYFKHTREFLTLESGVRYSLKNISTFQTGTINTGFDNPGTTIQPFNNLYNSLNGSLGISVFDHKFWNFKSNISSGFRAGNLAELSSNGVHEGSLRYEIGNINLKTEQNVCADLLGTFDSKHITITSSIYINRFFNYIYLSPTNEEYVGYQIFRYIQENATLKGTESIVTFHPNSLKWLVLKSSHSIVIGQTDKGNYLPFIPAQKINSEIKFILQTKGKFKSSFFRIGSDCVFAQNRPGQFETASPAYFLMNAGIGTTLHLKKMKLDASVSGTNILNNTYYDHLARLKYFGLYNMGQNIVLNLKFNF